MCGIIGFNWEDKKLLGSALKEIKHRGPDASGQYLDKTISLGHRRLAIVDLSKSANQPMCNEDENIWVIFNGEIYNHKELKKNLRKKHSFKSESDTEILLHLYEEDGFSMVNKLQGMFAFCIYDSRKKILFMARDRAGIKPLYYYHYGKKFMFCSEIKGILANDEIKREVNIKALESYLVFRANCDEETFFKKIKKLIPGHILVYNLKNNKIHINKYWDVKYSPIFKDKNEVKKTLFDLLQDSVRARLMSDVPYGAYLSGGVDSGTIVALMKKFSLQKIKTFSVGFDNEKYDETKEARFLSEKLDTEHYELLIKEDSVKKLPEIVYQSDEPMADPTAIPIYYLSRYTKKYSTVILTGEGSDEIFAGYPQYKFMKIHQKILRNIPLTFRRAVPSVIKFVPAKFLNLGFRFASSLGEKGIERFSNFVNSNDLSEQYLNQTSIFNEKEQSELLGKKINIYRKYSKYFKGREDIVTKSQNFDFKNPMVEDLLMKIDKNTMAFAIEGRVPFLDYRIIEFAAKISPELKLRGFTKDKYILRETVKNILPRQTSKRKKRHFFVPIDSWFKNELANLRDELLSDKYIKKQKIFNNSYIKKIKEDFNNSKLFYSRQLWSLLVFQIWYKQYIENEKIRL